MEINQDMFQEWSEADSYFSVAGYQSMERHEDVSHLPGNSSDAPLSQQHSDEHQQFGSLQASNANAHVDLPHRDSQHHWYQARTSRPGSLSVGGQLQDQHNQGDRQADELDEDDVRLRDALLEYLGQDRMSIAVKVFYQRQRCH